MVWAHLKDEQRWKPKVDFECATKRKTPKRNTEIKKGTAGEERASGRREELRRGRQVERRVKSKSKSLYDRRLVGQSIMVSSPIWGS
jgi:hypothetical protein